MLVLAIQMPHFTRNRLLHFLLNHFRRDVFAQLRHTPLKHKTTKLLYRYAKLLLFC